MSLRIPWSIAGLYIMDMDIPVKLSSSFSAYTDIQMIFLYFLLNVRIRDEFIHIYDHALDYMGRNSNYQWHCIYFCLEMTMYEYVLNICIQACMYVYIHACM